MRRARALVWSVVLCGSTALSAAGDRTAALVVRPATPARATVSAMVSAAAPVSAAAVQVRDVNGRGLTPFTPAGRAGALFFVQTDCPISNWYAPTIQRLCREYESRGVSCTLIYEDLETAATATKGSVLDAQVRTHLADYRYAAIPAVVDRTRAIARRAKASITPQVVVVDRAGDIRYRGRIDNAYADFGKPRQQVTAHDLRDSLDAILAGRPVPKPETHALGCYIVDPATLKR